MKVMTNPDNFPVMINCAHGKDRTGVVCALIQGCLGVSNEQIAQDYAQSEVGRYNVQTISIPLIPISIRKVKIL